VGRKRAMLYGIFTFVGTILGYGVVLFVMWYGGRLVINGELSIGDLSSFVMYTMTLTGNQFSYYL
jgi:ATP-binding cassette subfamily B protein